MSAMHQLIIEIDGTVADPQGIVTRILDSRRDVESWAPHGHKWISIVGHPTGYRQFTFIPLKYREGCGPKFTGESDHRFN